MKVWVLIEKFKGDVVNVEVHRTQESAHLRGTELVMLNDVLAFYELDIQEKEVIE